MDLSKAFLPPSMNHLLGTDPYGVELTTRILSGAGHSLSTAAIVTLFTIALGAAIGIASAFARQASARLILRIIDGFLAFPGLLLAILLASFMSGSDWTIIFALSATGWATHARLCHGLSRKILKQPFIEAARASGSTDLHIIRRHLLPHLGNQLKVQALLTFAHAILGEASLSFLGLGSSVQNSSWGRLIADGRQYLSEAPYLSIIPGFALFFTLMIFYSLGSRFQNKVR